MLVTFAAGQTGQWTIDVMDTLRGPALTPAAKLCVSESPVEPAGASWFLQGLTSTPRYATRAELDALAALQPPLARPQATCAALIAIRKNAAWWALGQDERRAIFEEQSHHNAIGMQFLPAIARRLHHSRDLGQPFDFLTWFEFAPAAHASFNQLLHELRRTTEWIYVDREIDIRLSKTPA